MTILSKAWFCYIANYIYFFKNCCFFSTMYLFFEFGLFGKEQEVRKNVINSPKG